MSVRIESHSFTAVFPGNKCSVRRQAVGASGRPELILKHAESDMSATVRRFATRTAPSQAEACAYKATPPGEADAGAALSDC